MTVLLTIHTVVASILLLILIFSLTVFRNHRLNNDGGMTILSIVGLVLVGLFGFVLGACVSVGSEKTVEVTPYCELAKSQHVAFVHVNMGGDDNETFTFDSFFDYENIDENTKFYYVKKYNHYGFELEEDREFYYSND